MRLFYLDPGLRNDVGHHANYCRYIGGALRARGVEMLVYARQSVEPTIQSELGAIPYFRYHTYQTVDPDPIAGWLTDFITISKTTRQELHQLPAMVPGDVVYFSSVRPAQLLALLEWRDALEPDRRPAIVVESVGTGLRVERTPDGTQASVPHPQLDPRATLFRYASNWLPREANARFHFITFGQIPSQLFNLILDYPTQTLPLPYPAIIPLRNRAGTRPITVAILGHQRSEKGYDHLPEIVEALLRSCSDIRLLLQVVDPLGPPKIQVRLREIAASNDRMMLEERPAGERLWSQLLERADLILCPHRREYYLVGLSTVVAEAFANGIPVVVPAGTPLETMVAECGGAGTTFDRFEAAAIVAATTQALDRFDDLAGLAYAAALRWPELRGPTRMVDHLLSLIASQ
jgi:glycosyltransferase involved in cell wall biosynthesis